MKIEYWHNRWSENRIGFDLGYMHPMLVKFWERTMGKPQKVLVPMCGKAQCMLFFKNLGVETHAIEINRHAIESFFVETGLKPQIQELEGALMYRCENLWIHCRDFFTYEGSFDAVYDRAALIAFPKHMRDAYLAKVAQLLCETGTVFLIALQHKGEKSPPFSLSLDNVYDECGIYFDIEHLRSYREKNVPGGDGYEHLFKLRKRSERFHISTE